jgi:hypothetical protein
LSETLKDVDGDAYAGLHTVVHVVAAIAVLDVDVVGIAPADWPGIDEPKRVATILKAPMLVVASANVEPVPTAKMGGVAFVRDATVLIATPGSARWL